MKWSRNSTANVMTIESVPLTKIDSSRQPYMSTCAIRDMVPAVRETKSGNLVRTRSYYEYGIPTVTHHPDPRALRPRAPLYCSCWEFPEDVRQDEPAKRRAEEEE